MYTNEPKYVLTPAKLMKHLQPNTMCKRQVADLIAACSNQEGIEPFSEMQALRLRNVFGYSVFHERINDRARTAALLREHANVDGMVNVCVWQRDCDCCEYTWTTEIAATLQAWVKLQHEIADGAEGPFSCGIMTQQEAAEFEPETRDRVLEAFERGEYYNV